MHHNKMSFEIPKDEIAIRMKKLKATKKAEKELSGRDEIFFGLLLALNLDKDQKKKILESQTEMQGIFKEYQS